MSKAYIGIDPGASGAVAVLTDEDEIVFDFSGDFVTASDFIKQVKNQYKVELAALEAVHAMPKQGVCSMFKLGTNYGAWQGILIALSIPMLLVSPRTWQKNLLMKEGGQTTKEQSLYTARRLFVDVDLSLKKHHCRSDALLIALHAKKFYK